MAGWSRCKQRSSRSASRPSPSTPASSARNFSRKSSTNYASPSIADYDERREQQLAFWNAQNGKQSGDPAKLAQALIALAGQEELPRRFIAGADSIGTAEQKIEVLQRQIDAYRDLSKSLAFDESQETRPATVVTSLE